MADLSFNMIKIVDNFLPDGLHKRLQRVMMSAEFPWYFAHGVSSPDDQNYYFIHNVFGCRERMQNGTPSWGVESTYFNEFETILYFIEEKLKFQTHNLLRIRCNLYTNQNINLAHGSHTDHEIPHYTAIYYINNNNGPTTIGDKNVESVENRIVFFDGLIPHNSNLQTDVAERINININVQGEYLTE